MDYHIETGHSAEELEKKVVILIKAGWQLQGGVGFTTNGRCTYAQALVKKTPKKAAKRFAKPTADEVGVYARSIGFNLDPQNFMDWYDSVGWKVGRARTPMVCWKAAVRTWKKKEGEIGSIMPKIQLWREASKSFSSSQAMNGALTHWLDVWRKGVKPNKTELVLADAEKKHGPAFASLLKERMEKDG